MKTVFRRGFLEGTSQRYTDIQHCFDRAYDFTIFTSSWDHRCISIISQNLCSTFSSLILFRNKDSQGIRDDHDAKLTDFAQKISPNKFSTITGSSDSIYKMLDAICHRLTESYSILKRPLNILCDLTTCPHIISLALLGYCFKAGLAKSLTFFYSEGEYASDNVVEVLFTNGAWQLVNVPFFEGENKLLVPSVSLISVGFEGKQILQILSKSDPHWVSILFPDPGTNPDYPAKTNEFNNQLFDSYKIPETHVVRAHAADAIAAWAAVDSFSSQYLNEYDASYLCCGTKPHALALALDAFCKGFPRLLYRIPESYKVTATKPNGTYWTYTITDLSLVE